MKLRKVLAIVLVVAVLAAVGIALTACNDDENTLYFGPEDADILFGLICLHDENSTYDKNFIDAAEAMANKMGVRVIVKTGIPEDATCYDVAVDLADQGCDIVFADSFGHETHIMRAAEEFPEVKFGHATGTYAHTSDLNNFYNAFASIYEGRYLAGVVAGYEIKSMIDSGEITASQAKMGYVGAFPYAEVVSGFTSFYLGAKSVVPEVTMEVRYTNSWYDPEAEENTAKALINNNCILISQHADSYGAPDACEEAGVPNVTYNISTKSTHANTYLVGSKINWEPYYEVMVNAVRNNTEIPKDWTGTLNTDSVQILEYGNSVSEEAKTAVNTALEKMKNGTLKVFDLSTFTCADLIIDGNNADVDTDAAYTPDHNVIKTENGITYFSESDTEFRSAPYFTYIIDGITSITE